MKKLARLKLHALMELSSQLLEDVVDVLVDEDVDVEEVEGVVDEVEMEEEMAMVTKREMIMMNRERMKDVDEAVDVAVDVVVVDVEVEEERLNLTKPSGRTLTL